MTGDQINLTLPARPEYILTIRMAVSTIAARLDFDIDTIEDLKAGAAEACILSIPLLDVAVVDNASDPSCRKAVPVSHEKEGVAMFIGGINFWIQGVKFSADQGRDPPGIIFVK